MPPTRHTDSGLVAHTSDADMAQDAALPSPDAAAPLHYDTPLPPGEWEGMDFDARKRFMIDMVVPTMRPLFMEFDSERFAAVGCKTCHGSGAKAGDFKLPNPDLPALSSAALMNPPEDKKAIMDFMRTVLKPRLAELLGKQEAPGVRCSTCHTSTP